jgi:hypothetical protein
MNGTEYTNFDKFIYCIDFGVKTVCWICISPLLIIAIPFSPLIYYHLKDIEKEKKEHSEYMKKYYECRTKQIQEEKQKEQDKLIEIIRSKIVI